MTVAVDFDGVVHGYSRGWADGTIYDPPLPGAIDALHLLMDEHPVFIFTTREPEQVRAWLAEYGFDATTDERCSHCSRRGDSGNPADCSYCKGSGLLTFWNPRGQLLVTNRKLAAEVYIDDRALHFQNWDQALLELGRRGI
ncbi:hypothetical protein ACIRJO_02730 [Streptomyces sp. NPDC102394]|uniref:hypothetical protein n=1 Tax=Streptomyces sp. NPDC102394 TaxID=3366167 RepID=UPI0038118D96